VALLKCDAVEKIVNFFIKKSKVRKKLKEENGR